SIDGFTSSRHGREKSSLQSFLEAIGRRRTQGYPNLFRSDRIRRRPAEITLRFRESFVRFFECFFAADVEPPPLNLKRVDWFAGVKPLQKPAWLVRVVARGQISRE